VRNAKELRQGGAHLVVVLIDAALAGDDQVERNVLDGGGQNAGHRQRIAALGFRVVDMDAFIGAHGQGRANGLLGLLRSDGEYGHRAPFGFLDAQGLFHGQFVVGVHDPFDVVLLDGYAVPGDLDQRFGVGYLFDQNHDVHA
jgi:hypothetical protein